MNFQKIILVVSRSSVQAALLAGLASSAACQQIVLILCPPQGTCTLQNVASVNIDGKNRLRLLSVAPESVTGPVSTRISRQIKMTEVPGGIIRNAQTGLFCTVPWTGRTIQVVLPPNL